MIKIKYPSSEIRLEPTLFPDGTSQIWNLPEEVFRESEVTVVWDFSHEAEFIHLAQLKHLLDAYHVDVDLKIEYLPYGRQDKLVSNGTTFGLKTFAALLNTLNFLRVDIVDPHSRMATKLIERSFGISEMSKHLTKIVSSNIVNPEKEEIFICFPDVNASRKYMTQLSVLEIPPVPWNSFMGSLLSVNSTIPIFPKFIHAVKHRNQQTGNIDSFSLVLKGRDIKDKQVIIVDDICDGGATFVNVAKELKKAGAKNIYLYVSHGLFTKGLAPLYEAGIDKVYDKKGLTTKVDSVITGRKNYE
jgi:ribose-phosphate pyrophosphokinase